MKINVIFHSIYGHIYRMAEAVAEGAAEVKGSDVKLMQVEEMLSEEVLDKMGATETKRMFSHIPVATVDDLAKGDATIFGVPTRYGMMTAQMRAFLDATGSLWQKGALVGKVGSVFTSTATQHGGQEATILSFHTTLLHHGMIIAGVPYSVPGISVMDEVSGGGPYGASTIAAPDGSRYPSENELSVAKFQGRHVAEITKKMVE
ncbi:flavoprotein WrbA [Methanosalsum zhilinae DSM 4017]|uniref:NAD(P)H dehydrogenase (quinone) n=1 Tax=Methanosalsum zhilinae (strain DSM 4017 / NBRC 107636 / OCM 62 / WeN5) TaxID=679901 RepID=F7XKS0_METZD|nr:NAD(P)H:quinone oxidoreductase [Methanosalsum zhilinae]AEH61783.1 flavoprotein WrbA [Methanosalsum zhilinae DSM 4017]